MKIKYFVKCFTTTTSAISGKKNQLYMWLSNVSPGRRKDDYKNFLVLSNYPKKIDFFSYCYMIETNKKSWLKIQKAEVDTKVKQENTTTQLRTPEFG
jgi:hypothetical protein